ncbi:MAG: H-NS histone family protein [Alphaproteobacteria bacterium]|jgi:DNA-binding protein H-NS|nr:H-NS histone family protein [Alphaproteobacteria bacterium]
MSKTSDTIENMQIPELLELKERVNARLEQLAEDEMAQLEQQMEELRPFVKGTGRKRATGKAPAKFKDPVSGKTWSGRGRTPVWLREREEKGEDREKFRIR